MPATGPRISRSSAAAAALQGGVVSSTAPRPAAPSPTPSTRPRCSAKSPNTATLSTVSATPTTTEPDRPADGSSLAAATVAVGDRAGLLGADEGSQGDVAGERRDFLHALGAP